MPDSEFQQGRDSQTPASPESERVQAIPEPIWPSPEVGNARMPVPRPQRGPAWRVLLIAAASGSLVGSFSTLATFEAAVRTGGRSPSSFIVFSRVIYEEQSGEGFAEMTEVWLLNAVVTGGIFGLVLSLLATKFILTLSQELQASIRDQGATTNLLPLIAGPLAAVAGPCFAFWTFHANIDTGGARQITVHYRQTPSGATVVNQNYSYVPWSLTLQTGFYGMSHQEGSSSHAGYSAIPDAKALSSLRTAAIRWWWYMTLAGASLGLLGLLPKFKQGAAEAQ